MADIPTSHRARLRAIAIQAMRSRGFDTEFPPDAIAAAAAMTAPPSAAREPIRDLRSLPWCSIDNDESRDLDQLTVARSAGEQVRILVAIADVDAAVPHASPIDRHAAVNTTSVYTPAVIFPMLPERLSTNLTSLAAHEDRLAIVIEFTVSPDGAMAASDVYRGLVRNHAKLSYREVEAWLVSAGPLPRAAAVVNGLDEQLRMQDRVAQALRCQRYEHGALDLEMADAEVVFEDEMLREVRAKPPGRAKTLIEDFMVAANGVTARFLEARGSPSLHRVVRQPARWDRLMAIAEAADDRLPDAPDAGALSTFLSRRREADPAGFPELSHTVIRLLGSGEYVVDLPGRVSPGHFGLAVQDYAHSTAPNRRYPDLITQRLLKASIAGHPPPYSLEELARLAQHCTTREDEANRVERQVRKSAVALIVEARIGERFVATVTGASEQATWVRVATPLIEGKLVHDEHGLRVGDRVHVQLVGVDVDRGFIDFIRAGS